MTATNERNAVHGGARRDPVHQSLYSRRHFVRPGDSRLGGGVAYTVDKYGRMTMTMTGQTATMTRETKACDHSMCGPREVRTIGEKKYIAGVSDQWRVW